MADRMRGGSWWSQGRRLLSPAVVVVAVTALVATALQAEGYQTPELELHDAGVWISWDNASQIGRTNTQISEVDALVKVAEGQSTLMQADAVVLTQVRSGSANVVTPIDTLLAAPLDPVGLPPDATVDLGGRGVIDGPTVAVLDRATGNLWVGAPATVLSGGFGVAAGGSGGEGADAPTSPPLETFEGATSVAVGRDGVAWVHVAETGEVVGFARDGSRAASHALPELEAGHRTELTVVGATPVVLDLDDQTLLLPGVGAVPVTDLGSSPVLQQAGPPSGGVLVATESALARVALADGSVTILSEEGTGLPAAPVVERSCSYGAWGGVPTYVEACGEAEAEAKLLESLSGGKALRFRTNRDAVVINEVDTGRSIVVLEDGRLADVDWDHALLQGEGDDESDRPPVEGDPERDPDQKPPVANDDVGADGFGTRPDTPVLVDPLRNDFDPNDDVLVISSVNDVRPDGARVEMVASGRTLQVHPAPGRADTVTFSYVIHDGFDASEPAQVEVRVRPEADNEGPELRGDPPRTVVVAGRSVTHNVLSDVVDPDGDPVSLVLPVTIDGADGSLTADVDGAIVYQAPIGAAGRTIEIPFTASDGRGSAGSELASSLTVQVLAEPGQPPVVRGDHAFTVVGQEVVVDVLANDTDADDDRLVVVGVGTFEGADLSVDDRNRVRVRPQRAGTITVEYSVSDGGEPVTGKLRVDVTEPGGVPPVAVRDNAMLRLDGSTSIDALANDFDADGDVLVIRSVEVLPDVGLTVELIDHRYLRLSAAHGIPLAAATDFTYTVSDGNTDVVGTVVVRPSPLTMSGQPPNTRPDTFTVRAGNVGAFDVLANDVDPEGGLLRVDLPPQPPELTDKVFVQGDLLRFVAPEVPGSFQVTYQAVDPTGRASSATVDVQVLPADLTQNRPPQPPDLTARVVAGETVEIAVPVTSIDPDGDDVTLMGVGTNPPSHGAVVDMKADRLTYRPDVYEGGFRGTDTFTYQVRDAHGMQGTAMIRVGVVAPPDVNSPPVAVDDLRQVGEGGSLEVRVVGNDTDADDDVLSLVPDSLGSPAGATWTVSETDAGRVAFSSTGMVEGEEAAFTYEVTDGVLRDQGLVRVKVVPESENLPPLAADDRGAPAGAGEVVDIDVLDNDEDPDGDAAGLILSVPPGSPATVVGDLLRVTMADRDVAVVYTITDPGGLSAQAVARVRLAGVDQEPPVARYDPGEIGEGEPITIEVLDNDETSTGDKRLLEVEEAGRNGTCTLVPPSSVTFEPRADFWGWGGCTYVLGDGPGDAVETQRALGTVGVEVIRSTNNPPRFIEQHLSMVAGEELVIEDLTVAVRDPDGDAVRFPAIEGSDRGVNAALDGSRLTIRVDGDAVGGLVELVVSVNDGTDTVKGRIVVSVPERGQGDGDLTGESGGEPPDQEEQPGRPGIAVPDRELTVAPEDVVIDVLANDQPAEDGSALELRGVTQPSAGSASVEGSKIRYTPGPGFHGTAVFTYTVFDGTNELTATVEVTVMAVPDAPAAPAVERASDGVLVSWGYPDDNGSPITEYWVRSSGGAGARVEKGVRSAPFHFDGLTNGDTYTFQVAAVNAAVKGSVEPKWSASSESIRLIAIPPTPNAPLAVFNPASGDIDVTWEDPGGDAVEFEVQSSPAAGAAYRTSGTSYTPSGLVDGTPYRFQVRAFNELGEESEWSAWSAPETPASPPDAPGKPQIVSEGNQQITVSWTAPADNGDPVRSYEVVARRDGADAGSTVVNDPNVRELTLTTDNGPSYTFEVRATNKAGPGPYSSPSDPAKSCDVPGPVSAVSAKDGDGSVTVSWQPPATDNGCPVTQYSYRASTGASGETASTAATVSSSNGQPVTIEVSAINERGPGPSANSNEVIPYGPPSGPTNVSGTNTENGITWSWAKPTNTNGRALEHYEVSIGDSPVGPNATSISTQHPKDGKNVTFSIVAVTDGSDGARNRSAPVSITIKRPEPPPPPSTVTLVRGPSAQGKAGCSSAGCSLLRISWSNLPGGAHSYSCQHADGTEFWYQPNGISGASGTANLVCYADASVWGGVRVVIDGTYVSNSSNW